MPDRGFITGDKTILRLFYLRRKSQSAVFCFENEFPELQVRTEEWGPRIMVCVFFGKADHLTTIPVMQHRTVTAEWYTTHALPVVLEAWDKKKKRRSDLRLQHDNAPAHTAKLT